MRTYLAFVLAVASGFCVACGDDGGGDSPGDPDAGDPSFPDPTMVTVFDDVRINSRMGQPNLRGVSGDVDFGQGPFASVTLEVELGTTCFPFEQWEDDPPPEGENWPPRCDAFDRNFEFELDPPEDEGDPPPIELVRAITPFGGPMDFTVDLTDVANARPGEHVLRARITTFSDGAGQVSGSDGGWNLTTRLRVEPGPPPRNVVFVAPLLRTSVRSDTAEQSLPFDVPEEATSVRIEYRVTGHGGDTSAANPCGVDQDPRDGLCCVGGSEEFCARAHAVGFDGELTESFVPWIDCDDEFDACGDLVSGELLGRPITYCERNPTGSVASVRAPRANWCPNRVTPPIVFERALSPGPHTFDMLIARVATGIWATSVTAFGYAD